MTGLIPSGRLAALDGVRTFAVAAVFTFHGAAGLLPGGAFGVDVFFVLSGFVITLLMMGEHQRTGGIRLGVFYLRRLARLWPALIAVCVFVLVLALLEATPFWSTQDDHVLPAITYVMNLAREGVFGEPIGGQSLGHTWSLAVEEQFYLVWPLVLIGLLRLLTVRRAAVVTLGLVVVAALWRAILAADDAGTARLYNGPDTRADQLLLGCSAALLLLTIAPGSPTARRLRAVAPAAVVAAAAALVVAMLTIHDPTASAWTAAAWAVWPVLVAVLTAVIIVGLVVVPSSWPARLLAHPWLAWPGRELSYGIYLWHLPMYYAFHSVDPIFLRVPLVAVVTVVAALVSRRLVERPVRRRVAAATTRSITVQA